LRDPNSNQIITYSRNFIENFVRSNDKLIVEIKGSIVIIKYDNQIMYLKYDDSLVNSSYYIADKVFEKTNDKNTYKNYYYVDIEPKDII
jgi:hypothetical protein